MSTYAYEAVNAEGFTIKGAVDVATQSEALQRIRDMGLFPTRLAERRIPRAVGKARRKAAWAIPFLSGGVKVKSVALFTRQLATVIDAGMPLLRGLHILQEQEANPAFKAIIGEVAEHIEGGNSLSETLGRYPKVFNGLYLNMVKAGEAGGVIDAALLRLSEFMEKSERIKGKVVAALFYPVAVMIVACGILALMLVFVVPKFKTVFEGLLNGQSLPGFTLFVLNISDAICHHFLTLTAGGFLLILGFSAVARTDRGRLTIDRLKLRLPVFGMLFSKVAISRLTRTLGTLLSSGVPILQALDIVKQTTGNAAIARAVEAVNDSVKQGETIAVPLKASGLFPPLVAGMVDVGEQTGALPDMLLKIASNYDEEVDRAVDAVTSLIEPIMIVFLAIVVGSIVIAMFLPIITLMGGGPGGGSGAEIGD